MNAVEISDLNFSYPASKSRFSIPKLIIGPGEKVFIHGPSGSGKTTLLNIILGLLRVRSGSLKLLGQNLENTGEVFRDKFRGSHLGVIFQGLNLIDYLSVYDNISLAYRSSALKKKKIKNVQSEIERLAAHLGIEELLSRSVAQLSVGQQQRVAMCRAFLGNPEIIIADEPTSALDQANTQKFMELLFKEHGPKKFTLIFVSHDKSLMNNFDRVIYIDEILKVEGVLNS